MPWYLYALGSAILIAVTSIIEKKILVKEHAMELSAVLAFFNAIFAVPLLFIVDLSVISLQGYLVIYGASILGSLAFLMTVKSLRHMQVSEVSPLFLLSPGISAFLAFVLLGEGLTRYQLSGMILLMIGAFILETKRGKNLLEPLRIIYLSRYIHVVFGALLLYGFGAILDRIILTRFEIEPLTFIAVVHVFLFVNFWLLLTIFHDGYRGIKHGIKVAGPLLLLVAMMTITHRFLSVQAMSIAFVGLVIAIKRSSSLFTTIIGGEIFQESHLLRKSVAALIMLGGVLMIVI